MLTIQTRKMNKHMTIRILEVENNRRGDLFARLMADLFVGLGYSQPRVNVHKSGRELELTAEHRLETRRVIAECKATADPIGGDDLNKFVGILDAEFNKIPSCIGYFISLSGFRETAKEQEQQRRRTKVVMLAGDQVIRELVLGNIIVTKERATEIAGRLCGTLDTVKLDHVELLAHDRGWIWCVYYTSGKDRTHFALIHSDGTPLASKLAKEVIDADSINKGDLSELTCLNITSDFITHPESTVSDALVAYRRYLANECGFIQFDGLPADSDVGSRRIRLKLYLYRCI